MTRAPSGRPIRPPRVGFWAVVLVIAVVVLAALCLAGFTISARM